MSVLKPSLPGEKSRSGAALAIAVVIHLGLALFLGTRQPPLPPQPRRITVQLVEKKHPPVVPETPRPPPERVVVGGGGTRGVARPRPPQPPTAPPSAPPPQVAKGPDAPTPSAEPAPQGVPSGVLLFDPNALRRGIARGTPSGGGGTGGGNPDDDNSPAAEKARVAGRIEHDIGEQRATERVEIGLVDPYFRQLSKGTAQIWKMRPHDVGASEKSDTLEDLAGMLKRWAAVGKTYGKTGNPQSDSGGSKPENNVRPAPRNAADQPYDPDLADFRAHWDTGRGLFVGGLLVVELTQDNKGDPMKIRVVRSSGNDDLDESAKKAIILAAKQRLAPAHGLGLGGDSILSVWKMEARAVPLACSFVPDLSGHPNERREVPSAVECGNNLDVGADGVSLQAPVIVTPFGAISPDPRVKVITRVELLAVYGGETGPVAAPSK